MKFTINNIGLILKAELLLNGITLIAAENDSGKSTIGKALFALIETSNSFEKEYLIEMTNRINGSFLRINNFLETYEDKMSTYEKYFIKDNIIIDEVLKKIPFKNYIKFSKIELIENIKKIISEEINTNSILELEKTNDFLQNLKFFYNELNNNVDIEKMRLSIISKWKMVTGQIESSINELEFIKDILLQTTNYEEIKKISFEKSLKREFKTGIKNIFLEEEDSSLILEEKGNITEIKFKNNKIISATLPSKEFCNKYNIIYLESPILLDYIDDICEEFSFLFNKNQLDENYKVKVLKNNLINKDQFDIVEEILGKEEILQEITKKIESIISGEFLFDNKNKSYSFKKDGKEIDIKNTANGIKTFGIIEMLLKNKKLNENCILIIDEPEVHLHPNWQVKYAEILTIISLKLGVKILLNSHSPYFIEAIKVYSEKYKNNIKFYSLIDSNDKKAKILIDKTNDLGFIYNKLIEAYDIIKQVEYSDV